LVQHVASRPDIQELVSNTKGAEDAQKGQVEIRMLEVAEAIASVICACVGSYFIGAGKYDKASAFLLWAIWLKP
jgi:hypothetical protein